jgi:homoserine dehydrogenase
LRVHPALIRKKTLLADVSDVFNAVMIKGEPVGETLFYGKGAGMEATSSAVVADIVDVALNYKYDSHRRIPAFRTGRQFDKVLHQDEIVSRYYIRLTVQDKPGVVAAVSQILGDNNISISSILQKEVTNEGNTSLLILTHEAREGAVKYSTSEIEKLSCVNAEAVLLRVEDL